MARSVIDRGLNTPREKASSRDGATYRRRIALAPQNSCNGTSIKKFELLSLLGSPRRHFLIEKK